MSNIEREEKKQVETKIKLLDNLINISKDLIEFMDGDRGVRLLENLKNISRTALEDYLRDNSVENQVRANMSTQLYNLFVLFKDKTAYENYIVEKEGLVEYLNGLKNLDVELGGPVQIGGAV